MDLSFKKIRDDKKGFTLLELLIVLLVIALLSIFTIGSYLSYRRGALRDLAALDISSQFEQMYYKVKFGQILNDGLDLYCYGIYYENGVFSKFRQKFLAKRTWDSIEGDWVYEGCESDFSNREDLSIDLDSDLNVRADNFVIRISPPDAEFDYSEDFGLSFRKVDFVEQNFALSYSDSDNYNEYVLSFR